MLKMLWLSLLLSLSATSVQSDKPGKPLFFNHSHFAYPGYETPSYFADYQRLIAKNEAGESLLHRCVRRQYPPEDGDVCREDPKVCLWGQQRCAEGFTEPTSRCNCYEKKWHCQAFFCPSFEDTCPASPPPESYDPETAAICKADMKCGYNQKACATCGGEVLPTTQCSCEAGQPFVCRDLDPCPENPGPQGCMKLQVAKKRGTIFPAPFVKERMPEVIEKPKPMAGDSKKADKDENPRQCPATKLEASTTTTCAPNNAYECAYDYSCCCEHGVHCAHDLKCFCTDTGDFHCEEKDCSKFICDLPPPMPKSPFPEALSSVNADCPSQSYAEGLGIDADGVCSVTNKNFYHCVYGWSCCCPDSTQAHTGRGCGTDFQCTCNAGLFTCDKGDCAPCSDSTAVDCPAEKPEEYERCSNDDGDSCGYGLQTCCNGDQYADYYCSCEGGGWTCLDATFLCAMATCTG